MDQLDAYRERMKGALMERARQSLEALGNLQFRQVGWNRDGQMIPSSSAEDIALQHIQLQAEAKILARACEICDEEYRVVMGQPKNPAPPGAAEQREALDKKITKEGVY